MRKLIFNYNKTSAAGLYGLLDIWVIIRRLADPHELKQIAKVIFKLLDSPDVPNHIWIKGHIYCAKTLIHDPVRPNHRDALRVLQRLCSILPDLPLADTMYSIQNDLEVGESAAPPSQAVRDNIFAMASEAEVEAEAQGHMQRLRLGGGSVDSPPEEAGHVDGSKLPAEAGRNDPSKPRTGPNQLEREMAEYEVQNGTQQPPPSKPPPHQRKRSLYQQQVDLMAEHSVRLSAEVRMVHAVRRVPFF